MNEFEKKPIESLTKQERESSLREIEDQALTALNKAAQQAKN